MGGDEIIYIFCSGPIAKRTYIIAKSKLLNQKLWGVPSVLEKKRQLKGPKRLTKISEQMAKEQLEKLNYCYSVSDFLKDILKQHSLRDKVIIKKRLGFLL